MPFIIPIFAGIGGALGLFGAAAILVGGAITVGATIGAGLLMSALSPKPQAPDVANHGFNTTVRVSDPPRQIVYGRRQIHAAEIYKSARGTNNEYLDVVHALATHEIDAIESIIIDGQTCTFDGTGACTSPASLVGFLTMHSTLGLYNQGAFTGPPGFTTNDRGRGSALVYLSFKFDQNAWPNGEPQDIAYVVRGKKVWDPRSGLIAFSSNASLIQADYLLDPVPNSRKVLGYLDKDVLGSSMFTASGLGSFDATKVADGDLTAAAWNTNSATAGATLSIDLGSGASSLYVQARIYCLAAGTAQYAVEWSDDNAAWTNTGTLYAEFAGWNRVRLATLGAHRYWRLRLLNTPGAGGGIADLELYQPEVDPTQLIADANLSDEAVTLAAGGTEKRYVAAGAFTMDATPKAIMESMLTASLGLSVWRGGKWYLYGAAWRGPTVTLTDDDLRGALKYSPLVSRSVQYNAVRGQFVAEKNKWQSTDYPAIENATFVQQDGEVIYKNIDFPWTPTASACQRMATLQMLRDRQQGTATLQCKLSAYQLTPPNVFNFTRARESWTNKAMEVVEQSLVLEQDAQGAPVLGVNMSCRDTDSSVYTWASNEAADITPGGTTEPDGRTVGAPSGLSLSSGQETGVDGVRRTYLGLAWTAPTDLFVTRIEVQYKKHADVLWTNAPTQDAAVTSLKIFGLTDLTAYDVQIRSRSVYGPVSAWVQQLNYTVTGYGSGMASYRPLSNPLSATDDGSKPVITIAGFSMRIAGVGDKAITGATLNTTAADYGKPVFIFYDDPSFAGGAVTFQYSQTREDALDDGTGAHPGRFFVGSINLPTAGGPDTVGNDDGGSGAQYSRSTLLSPGTVTQVSGTWTNPNVLLAPTGTTYASASPTSGGSNAVLSITGWASSAWQSDSLVLITQITAISGTGATALLEYSLDGGTTWLTARAITATDAAPVTTTIPLAPAQVVGDMQVRYTLPGGGGNNNAAANAGTAADDASVGTRAWSTPTNAQGAADGAAATAATPNNSDEFTHYLKLTNFGFAIPNTATILGIQAAITRKATYKSSPAGQIRYTVDSRVSLVKGGTVQSTNKADTSNPWPTAFAAKAYGGSSDLWGSTWLYSDINAATFGLVLSAENFSDASATTQTASVDAVTVTVYYTSSLQSSTGRIYSAQVKVVL